MARPAIPAEARLRALSGEQVIEQMFQFTGAKQIAVVSTYSEPEMKQLGGMERCYVLVRYFQKQNADPRRALAPNARVLGRTLKDMSSSDIERVLKEGGAGRWRVACERTCTARSARTAFDRADRGRADESTQPPGGTRAEIRRRLTRKGSLTWRRIHQ